MNEEEIFHVVAATPVPKRAAYLLIVCEGQPALRARIERLLNSHDHDAFMQWPADRADSAELKGELARLKPEDGGERIGNYKLIEKLGEGGFGTVWMAEQLAPVRRRVAFKIIKLGMDTQEVIARFELERQTLALMEHPNIAQVLDAGATAVGRPFFVMELVRGIRITDFCDQNNLTTPERLKLFIVVCHAIQHAHQKGIIHRDIKPSNILVTLHDGPAAAGCPKVIDFGVAKAIQSQRITDQASVTKLDQIIGTPLYMSPEQAGMSGLDIDTRSDIYSLGVLLYELLTGKTPFDAKELMASGIDAMRKTIREREPVRPSMRVQQTTGFASQSTLATDLDWIVMKALEKDRTRRYATANGLAADVQRHLDHDPVNARPPSGSYRLRKFVRRNKGAFAAALAMAVVLLMGVITSTSQAIRARRAEREQIRLRQQAETANRDLRDTVRTLELQRAEEFLSANDSVAGVAQLASLLRRDPSNHIAASRLISALVQRNWALPAAPPMRHNNRVTTAGFSPDGRHVLSASWDKTAQIWDATTGKSLVTVRHEDSVLAASYDRAGDRFVTASADGKAAIWNATNGTLLAPLLRHDGKVYAAEFSGDGQRVVTASADQSARIWDAATGALKHELRDEQAEVLIAHFSPENERVVIGTQSGTIRICRVDTGKIVRRLEGHRGRIKALAFSPDGRTLASSSQDGTVRLWDPANGQPLDAPLLAQPGQEYHAVAFSPDSRLLLTTSNDNKARLWDSTARYSLRRVLSHDGSVVFGAFSPDGKRVVTTSMDNSARLWDAGTGMPLCQPLLESEAILHAGFSPDGRRLVTASGAQVVQVWSIQPRRFIGIEMRHEKPVMRVAFDPRGETVFSASLDWTARLWNARTGEALGEPMRHHGAVRSADYSADGRRIVTASEDATACVWDSSTGQLIAGPLQHAKSVWFAEFSPNGERVATASADGTARVWDARTGKSTTPPLEHGAGVNVARFSPDGRWIVTASENWSARVWDAQSGEPVTGRLKHNDHVEWVEFSPDSRHVVSASSDNTARIWEVRTGEPIGPSLRHARTVQKAVFSPDGRRVVTVSLDRTARIWDASSGEALTHPLMHDSPVGQVCFSADGRRILTSCWSGTSRLWDADTGLPLTEWLEAGGGGFSACFDSTGRRIVGVHINGTVRVWDTPPAPTPVPPWFLALAEAVAGTRLSAHGNTELVSRRELKDAALRPPVRVGEGDFYEGLSRWFLADPSQRPASPF